MPKTRKKNMKKAPAEQGPEVFVLPPYLLQQLGINFSGVTATDSPKVDKTDATTKSAVQDTVFKKPKRSLAKSLKSNEESSVMTTAKLMRESVFLSPSFVNTEHCSIAKVNGNSPQLPSRDVVSTYSACLNQESTINVQNEMTSNNIKVNSEKDIGKQIPEYIQNVTENLAVSLKDSQKENTKKGIKDQLAKNPKNVKNLEEDNKNSQKESSIQEMTSEDLNAHEDINKVSHVNLTKQSMKEMVHNVRSNDEITQEKLNINIGDWTEKQLEEPMDESLVTCQDLGIDDHLDEAYSSDCSIGNNGIGSVSAEFNLNLSDTINISKQKISIISEEIVNVSRVSELLSKQFLSPSRDTLIPVSVNTIMSINRISTTSANNTPIMEKTTHTTKQDLKSNPSQTSNVLFDHSPAIDDRFLDNIITEVTNDNIDISILDVSDTELNSQSNNATVITTSDCCEGLIYENNSNPPKEINDENLESLEVVLYDKSINQYHSLHEDTVVKSNKNWVIEDNDNLKTTDKEEDIIEHIIKKNDLIPSYNLEHNITTEKRRCSECRKSIDNEVIKENNILVENTKVKMNRNGSDDKPDLTYIGSIDSNKIHSIEGGSKNGMSERVDEIAFYLKQYMNNRNKQSREPLELLHNSKKISLNSFAIKPKSSIHGIEKPGGSKSDINRMKHHHDSVQRNVITYKNNNKVITRPTKSLFAFDSINCETNDIDTLNTQDKFKYGENFCLCSDYGCFTLYSPEEDTFDHIHFSNKDSLGISIENLCSDLNYLDILEQKLQTNDLLPDFFSNLTNENEAICWRAWEEQKNVRKDFSEGIIPEDSVTVSSQPEANDHNLTSYVVKSSKDEIQSPEPTCSKNYTNLNEMETITKQEVSMEDTTTVTPLEESNEIASDLDNSDCEIIYQIIECLPSPNNEENKNMDLNIIEDNQKANEITSCNAEDNQSDIETSNLSKMTIKKENSTEATMMPHTATQHDLLTKPEQANTSNIPDMIETDLSSTKIKKDFSQNPRLSSVTENENSLRKRNGGKINVVKNGIIESDVDIRAQASGAVTRRRSRHSQELKAVDASQAKKQKLDLVQSDEAKHEDVKKRRGRQRKKPADVTVKEEEVIVEESNKEAQGRRRSVRNKSLGIENHDGDLSGEHEQSVTTIGDRKKKSEKQTKATTNVNVNNTIESKINLKRKRSSVATTDEAENEIAIDITECGVCDMKVNNSEWISHIATKHCYLARKKGDPIIDANNHDVVQSHLSTILVITKSLVCPKCGYKRKSVQPFMDHMKNCDKTNEPNSLITEPRDKLAEKLMGSKTCAICSKIVPIKSWTNHAFEHYNLAWAQGEESIDLKDVKIVNKILNEYKKAAGNLKCRLCGDSRSSNMGFYAHVLCCGKSLQQIAVYTSRCGECGKDYLCIYEQQHMTAHRQQERRVLERQQARAPPPPSPPPTDDDQHAPAAAGSLKRRAARKAISKIQKLDAGEDQLTCENCEFVATSKKQLSSHECRQDWSGGASDSEDSLEFASDGTDADGTDEQSDTDIDAADDYVGPGRKRLRPKTHIVHRYERIPYEIPHPKEYIKQAAKQFEEYHFSKETLFPEWRKCQYTILSEDQIQDYLPQVTKSCKVSLPNEEWTTFERFESFRNSKSSRAMLLGGMFLGAAPACMSWVPCGAESGATSGATSGACSRRRLAVVTHSGHDLPRLGCGEVRALPTMLQIWDVSHDSKQQKASLVMCAALAGGAAWSMSWCPSGARDDARLGLLALATSDSRVYVYCVPEPTSLPSHDSRIYIKLEPVAELRLHSDPNKNVCQPTSVSWSLRRGHGAVGAGYSSGAVALFLLAGASPLGRERGAARDLFYPYYTQQVHDACVTGFSMYPGAGGGDGGGRSEDEVWVSASQGGVCMARAGGDARVRLVSHACAAPLLPLWPAALLCSDDNPCPLVEWGLGAAQSARGAGGAAAAAGACSRCAGVALHAPPLLRLAAPHPALAPLPPADPAVAAASTPLQTYTKPLMRIELKKIKNRKNNKIEDDETPHISSYDETVRDFGVQLKYCKPGEVSWSRATDPRRFPLADVSALAFCPAAAAHHHLAVALHCGLLLLLDTER